MHPVPLPTPPQTSPAVDEAIRLYPCLARLRDLVVSGTCPFRFLPLREGHPLLGVRVWSEGTVDSLAIVSEQQARIIRVMRPADTVFEHVDTLERVIDAITDRLVHPSDPRAPRLTLPRHYGYTPSGRR